MDRRRKERQSRSELSRSRYNAIRMGVRKNERPSVIASRLGVSRQWVAAVAERIKKGIKMESNGAGRPLSSSSNAGCKLWKIIGERCRDKRKQLNMSQGDIVDITNSVVNLSDVSLFERGMVGLSFRRLSAVCKSLGTTIDDVWPTRFISRQRLAKLLDVTEDQAVDVMVYVQKLK